MLQVFLILFSAALATITLFISVCKVVGYLWRKLGGKR